MTRTEAEPGRSCTAYRTGPALLRQIAFWWQLKQWARQDWENYLQLSDDRELLPKQREARQPADAP